MSLFLMCLDDVLDDSSEVLFAWVSRDRAQVDAPETWVVRELAEYLDGRSEKERHEDRNWTPCISLNEGENWDPIVVGKGELS